MEQLQKIFLGIGIVLLVLIPIWIFLIVPELEKMPADYSYEVIFAGTEAPNYEVGGELPAPFPYRGIKTNKVVNIKGNILIIEEYFKAEELNNDQLWEI